MGSEQTPGRTGTPFWQEHSYAIWCGAVKNPGGLRIISFKILCGRGSRRRRNSTGGRAARASQGCGGGGADRQRVVKRGEGLIETQGDHGIGGGGGAGGEGGRKRRRKPRPRRYDTEQYWIERRHTHSRA